MPAQYTQAKKDQSHTHQVAYKSALQPCAHQDTKAKRGNSCTPHHILAAHKNTPRIIVCGGCCVINRQDRLF